MVMHVRIFNIGTSITKIRRNESKVTDQIKSRSILQEYAQYQENIKKLLVPKVRKEFSLCVRHEEAANEKSTVITGEYVGKIVQHVRR